MTDFGGSIPAGMISICKAFETVYQTLTPDREVLEERVNPSSSFHHGLSEQDAKCSREGAWRSYDQRRLRASEWLRKKLSRGSLIAQYQKKKRDQQLSPDRWDSMGAFEAMGIFETGIAIVRGKRRRLHFDPKEFENVLLEIAHPTTKVDAPRVVDKGGRRSEYAWNAVKPLVLRELAARGKPHKDNLRLPSKAQLVELAKNELGKKYDEHPSDTAVKYHVDRWIAEFDKN
jgi:hypothetical protein